MRATRERAVLALGQQLERASRTVSIIAKRGSAWVPPARCTRLLSRSEAIPAATSSCRSRRALHTAPAPSSVQPPANAEKRRNSCCSAASSRLKLQSSVLRSVCWRAGTSRLLLLSVSSGCADVPNRFRGQQLDARRRELDGERQPVHAAADPRDIGCVRGGQLERGIRRGRPLDEQRDRRILAERREIRQLRNSGSVSGGTGESCSPYSRSRKRLVTRMFSGARASSRPTSSGAASSRCSKLSRASNIGSRIDCCTCAGNASASERPSVCRSPRTCASVEATASALFSEARLMKATPPGSRSRRERPPPGRAASRRCRRRR